MNNSPHLAYGRYAQPRSAYPPITIRRCVKAVGLAVCILFGFWCLFIGAWALGVGQ